MLCYILAAFLISSSFVVKTQDLDCRLSSDDVECSGRGICVNGLCECDARPIPLERVFGKYCECDNFSCERHNGLLCAGTDHGICECGQCACNPNWGGSDCSLFLATDQCKETVDKEICSGHGQCVYGVCRCETSAEGRYNGKFCEHFSKGGCDEMKDCVACQMYKAGPLKDDYECMTKCLLFTPIATEKIEIYDEFTEKLCIVQQDSNCQYKFKYADDNGRLVVTAMQEMNCHLPVPNECLVIKQQPK